MSSTTSSSITGGGRCGLNRTELKEFNWVTPEGRCKALCEDERVCGDPYTKHAAAATGDWVRDLTCEGVEANPRPCNGGTEAIDGKCPANCAVFVPNEEKKNFCDYCKHHKACHTDVAGNTNVSTGTGKRKIRKSLPPPHSGSNWTADDLQRLNIVILPMSHQQVIGVDSEEKLPPLSDRATNLLHQCIPVLDVPHAVDKIFLGERVGAVPDQDPRTRSGVEWVLLKYLSLMVGQGRMKLESVVDDFLIHLLVALGYNDGDLVVLSKNQLDMTMNRSNEYATADITVFDVIRRFRLVVMEEKQEEPTGTSKSKLANYEAQLVAEALAAAQANVMQQEKRRRATSEGGDVHSPHFADSTAGVIYLVRVVGPVFSFYSINPSIAFLNIFEDYRQLGDDQEPPVTVVSKCFYTFPSNPSDPAVSALSAADRTWTEFNFLVPAHRHLIVSLLDWIRSRITA